MRVIAIIVCIAVGYYVALCLIHSLKRQLRGMGGGHGAGYGQGDATPQEEHVDREERYRQILGITKGDSPADIKRKYRDLLAKYHPDKVQHLGVEFQEMAADKTRKILEAYDFFRKRDHG